MSAPFLKSKHGRLTLKLCGIALGSFAFGYALVPFYNVLCSITGLGDQTALARRAVAVEQPDLNRTITVDFMAELPTIGSWAFRPLVRSIQIHPGKLYSAEYFCAESHRLRHDCAGRAECLAVKSSCLLPQDRVLLLHPATLCQG